MHSCKRYHIAFFLGIICVFNVTRLAADEPATQPTTFPATQPTGRTAADPIPTQEQLQQLFDAGNNAELLRQLPRALALRGKLAEQYSQYDLKMMLFELQMRQKAQHLALGTLADAQELTDDPKKISYNNAVAELIKRSKQNAYQPAPNRKEKPAPIDIIDRESRKLALKAMYKDELLTIAPKVEKALDGHSMVEIFKALQMVKGLSDLERAAEMENETGTLAEDLRDRGVAVITKAVSRMDTLADKIEKDADRDEEIIAPNLSGGRQLWKKTIRKWGLEQQDISNLKEIIQTCDDIAANGRDFVLAAGGKARAIEDVLASAEDLKKKAERILDTYPVRPPDEPSRKQRF